MGGSKRTQPMDLVAVSKELCDAVDRLEFSEPVAYVYNPLVYAWSLHRAYLERFGRGTREILMLGMNPGPWGMAQTGVPFGEVALVRDWMGLEGEVSTPTREHPKRPVQGLECPRSEVSGARLWGWAKERYGSADAFFERFFVTNYCPLVFMEESAKNRTPDKLPKAERDAISEACDLAFRRTVELMQPRLIIGVGAYAEAQAKRITEGMDIEVSRILHPSPASPIANRGWAPQAEKQLEALGVL